MRPGDVRLPIGAGIWVRKGALIGLAIGLIPGLAVAAVSVVQLTATPPPSAAPPEPWVFGLSREQISAGLGLTALPGLMIAGYLLGRFAHPPPREPEPRA